MREYVCHRLARASVGFPRPLDQARPGDRRPARPQAQHRAGERSVLRPRRQADGRQPDRAGAEVRAADRRAFGRAADRLHELQLPPRSFRHEVGLARRGRRRSAYGCAAFGMDRLALAMFATHGTELRNWPASVRAALSLKSEPRAHARFGHELPAAWTGSGAPDQTTRRGHPAKSAAMHSKTWTFFDGDWHEGNVPIMGPRTHAAWLGSMVFDGARTFEGVTPDLDLHCARVNRSAESFFLKPVVSRRHLDRARARRHQALRHQCRTLHPADVLGRDRPAGGIRHDPEFDPLVPVHLRGGDAEADRAAP